MNLLLDISHPAYAHALHPFILEMQKRRHHTLIFARDKEITHQLLRSWGIEFINKGKGRKSLLLKILYTFQVVRKMYRHARKFKPDIIISYSSYHASITGWLLRKPTFIFEDTEAVPIQHRINSFFSTHIITPESFRLNLGKNHIRFPSYKELAHLHPNHFTPNPTPQSPIPNPQNPKPYILLRFVSWQAWHDRGHSGVSMHMKEKIIKELSHFGTVYISSENPLPEKWQKHKVPAPPEHIHSFMAGASMLFGESASMAAEAAVLGIPAIYIDNTCRGYTDELENKYDLLYRFGESDEQVNKALDKAISLLELPNLKISWQQKRERMLSEKIDLCEWMVDFVEKEVRGKG